MPPAGFTSRNTKVLGPRARVLCHSMPPPWVLPAPCRGVRERFRIPALLPAFLRVLQTSRPASALALEGPGSSTLLPAALITGSGPGSERVPAFAVPLPRLRRLLAPAALSLPVGNRSELFCFSSGRRGTLRAMVTGANRAATARLFISPGRLLHLSSRAARPRDGDLWDTLFIQLQTELNLAAWGAWRVKHHPRARWSCARAVLVQIPNFQRWHSWRARPGRCDATRLAQGRDPCLPRACLLAHPAAELFILRRVVFSFRRVLAALAPPVPRPGASPRGSGKAGSGDSPASAGATPLPTPGAAGTNPGRAGLFHPHRDLRGSPRPRLFRGAAPSAQQRFGGTGSQLVPACPCREADLALLPRSSAAFPAHLVPRPARAAADGKAHPNED